VVVEQQLLLLVQVGAEFLAVEMAGLCLPQALLSLEATQQQTQAAAAVVGQVTVQQAVVVATVRPALSSSGIPIPTRWLQQQPALP